MAREKSSEITNRPDLENRLSDLKRKVQERLVGILTEEIWNVHNVELLLTSDNFIYTNFLFSFEFDGRRYFWKLNLGDKSIWYHISVFLEKGEINWDNESSIIRNQYRDYKLLNEEGIETIRVDDIFFIRGNILIFPYLRGYSLDKAYRYPLPVSNKEVILNLVDLLRKLKSLNERRGLAYGDLKFDNLFFDEESGRILLIDPQLKPKEFEYDMGKLSFNGLLLDYANRRYLLTQFANESIVSLGYNPRSVRWRWFEIYTYFLNSKTPIKSQEAKYFLEFYDFMCKIRWNSQ